MRQQQHLVRLSFEVVKKLKIAQQKLRVPPGRPPTLSDVVGWLFEQYDKTHPQSANGDQS